MKMEKMNIPPKPYRCNVRRPVRSINGMDANVIITCADHENNYQYCINIVELHRHLAMAGGGGQVHTMMAPIPIVANFAFSSVKPALVNKNVE